MHAKVVTSSCTPPVNCVSCFALALNSNYLDNRTKHVEYND